MRLGIDAREIEGGVYTGIGRALANFLCHFPTFGDGDSCVLFSTRKIPVDFGPKVVNVVIPPAITFIWDQWHLPAAIKNEKIDIFYSPYYKVPLTKNCPTVSAVLDLMYLLFQPYHDRMPFFARAYYRIFGSACIAVSDKVLTCSGYSKEDIRKVYGTDPKKIAVVHLSVGDNYFKGDGPSRVQGPYLLYVGNFKAHKNINTLILAFTKIAPAFPDLRLVLAGPKEHEYPALVDLVRANGLEGRVVFIGKVTDADSPHLLYANAQVFVMPTLYEGFGLPLVEAMACGVPVVASNTTSVPEVVKDAGILVDPKDAGQIAAAVKQILQDPVFKSRLIANGMVRVKDYDAAVIARRTYDLFKSVFAEAQKSRA